MIDSYFTKIQSGVCIFTRKMVGFTQKRKTIKILPGLRLRKYKNSVFVNPNPLDPDHRVGLLRSHVWLKK
jgi:hypothetical protein